MRIVTLRSIKNVVFITLRPTGRNYYFVSVHAHYEKVLRCNSVPALNLPVSSFYKKLDPAVILKET